MGYSANSCPYISFVIGFRNDNYTKNAIQKLNTSIKVLIDQLENVSLNSEIIIVDWNSPDPSKPLINEINTFDKSSHVSLHLYEVDGKQHLSIVSTGGYYEEYDNKDSAIYTFAIDEK